MQQLGKGPALGQKAPPAGESWDAGRLIMNLGAVSSLSGFMMSDVLYLRCLSVFGSLCGITYNATRQPAQWNGVAWGCVFISTNLYMIYNLLLERAEIKFSVDELRLYQTHFEAYGVTPGQFHRLMKLANWERLEPGATVVAVGDALDRVIYVHRGRAEVWGASFAEGKARAAPPAPPTRRPSCGTGHTWRRAGSCPLPHLAPGAR